MILALFLAALARTDDATTSFPEAPQLGRPVVQVREVEGERRWSVAAKNAPLRTVLERVGDLWGSKDLDGTEHFDRSTLVTAQLVDRPISQVLDFVLGSVGLEWEVQGNLLTVRPQRTNGLADEEAILLAEGQWLTALRRYPNAPEAPSALMSLAELQELRGLSSGARSQYEALVDRYPESEQVPEAMMRIGRLYKRDGDFEEAARVFSQLAGRADAPEYVANAFLELAACRVQLSKAQEALYILDLLEDDHPVSMGPVRAERMLVRAAALNGLERWSEALRVLDLAEPHLDPLTAKAAHQIRALGLSGVGYKSEASRAWLQYAHEATPAEKPFAYEQAAELALEARDELAVLFVQRQAAADGVESPTLPGLVAEAERRLGLVRGPAAPVGTSDAKLGRLESLAAEGQLDDARSELEQLYRGRGALPAETQARVLVLMAKLVASDAGLEDALALLAEERVLFDEVADRRRLDLEAARMLEAASLWERAAEAYEGRY